MKLFTRTPVFSDSSSQFRTQIKVCGITRIEDAIYAAQCGVDAIGLIFYSPSPRNVGSEQAKKIRQNLPESVASVAVVVDPDDELLNQIVEEVKPDFIQFHGNESPDRCQQSGLPFLKAFRVRSAALVEQAVGDYSSASAVLLDAYIPDKVGGTGQTFSWDLVPQLEMPIILAGGLDSSNIAQAIQTVNPVAVDVSTGVESSPGIKDNHAVREFVMTVNNVCTMAS